MVSIKNNLKVAYVAKLINVHGDNELLDDLYIKSNYVLVHNGQKLYDIYNNVTNKVAVDLMLILKYSNIYVVQ